ncbi:MAG: hypothetical protein AAGB12_02545 [Pseudomonadota bacterium]
MSDTFYIFFGIMILNFFIINVKLLKIKKQMDSYQQQLNQLLASLGVENFSDDDLTNEIKKLIQEQSQLNHQKTPMVNTTEQSMKS